MNRPSCKYGVAFAWAMALLLGECSIGAAKEPPRFEGTWQLSKPQTQFRFATALPFTPAGRQNFDDHAAAAAKGDFSFDITTMRCSSPGLPRIMLAPGRFHLYVRNDVALMRFEWNRLFRQISFAKERRHPPAPDSTVTYDRGGDEMLYGTAMGKSYGHWEGDQLVVESDGFESKLLDNLLPGSDDLKLRERLRLIDKNTLEDRIRIEDPVNFTEPWETVLTYKRVADDAFPEDVCLDRKEAGGQAWPR